MVFILIYENITENLPIQSNHKIKYILKQKVKVGNKFVLMQHFFRERQLKTLYQLAEC